MNFLRKTLEGSPALARLAPYVVLLILTFIQEAFAGPPRFWLYPAKMLVGLACIRAVRPRHRFGLVDWCPALDLSIKSDNLNL